MIAQNEKEYWKIKREENMFCTSEIEAFLIGSQAMRVGAFVWESNDLLDVWIRGVFNVD